MNAWCEVLDIAVPSLRRARGHPEANTYTHLLVALLEQGTPMTLEEVAKRFEEAGIAPAREALRALKRCRPSRPPVYRDGDLYELDPYSDDLDLWAFRLGLRPPKVPALPEPPPVVAPLPGTGQPLTLPELEDAFRDAYVWSWSALRMAMAVLDAQGGRLPPERLLDALKEMGTRHGVRPDSAGHWRDRAVTVAEDGDWVLDTSHPSVPTMRAAVRERVAVARRRHALHTDPAVAEANRRRWEERREAHAAELAGLRRALLYAAPFPGAGSLPGAITLVDVTSREATTWIGDKVADVAEALAPFDLVAAMEVRPLLRSLGLDPRARRLADLSPPQKSLTRRRGGTLVITTEMLIRGSCGISRPFGDPAALRRRVERGDDAAVRRRMEASACALLALYGYGRLHGAVRLRHSGVDELLPVPWVHRDETKLYGLMNDAVEGSGWMEVVLDATAGTEDPWASAIPCQVVPWPGSRWKRLLDATGWDIDERDVQRARIAKDPFMEGGLHDPSTGVDTVSFGLKILATTPPWDWSDDARLFLLEALNSRSVAEDERMLAMRLAGNLVEIGDDVAHALLRVTADPGESDTARSIAVISLGPALEEADMAVLVEDPDDAPISDRAFRHIQDTLRRLYHDPDVSAAVRMRVLEASVRAHADWHEGAVRAALHSGDPGWRLTALFCARYVPGFEDDILRTLEGEDLTLVLAAIRTAGAVGLVEAEGILDEIVDTANGELADAALDALMEIEEQYGLDDFDDLDDVDEPPDAGAWENGRPGKPGPTFH